MLRLLIFSIVAVAISNIDCLYRGDSCNTNQNQIGTCTPLSSCQPLRDEITRAGNPMPFHMRRKLIDLGCGFMESEPMVCCVVAEKPDGVPHPNDVIPPRTDPFNRDSVNPDDRDETNNDPSDISRHPNLKLLPTECGAIEDDRIWGGTRAHLYDMPWMVLLSYDDAVAGRRLSCGGTLINKWYVLTAAHCVAYLSSRLVLNGAILGEYDIRTNPDCEDSTHCAPPIRNATIDHVIAHPGYSPKTLTDDIALIRLSEPADFTLSTMKPICLPITRELQNENLEDKKVVIAGWGVTEEGMQSPVLMSVSLPIVSNKDCEIDYDALNIHLSVGQMCAGGEQNKDSCSGDSGGPLMFPGKVAGKIKYVQRGIVSFGSKRCALGGYPGIYTKVAYYMNWILDNIHN